VLRHVDDVAGEEWREWRTSMAYVDVDDRTNCERWGKHEVRGEE